MAEGEEEKKEEKPEVEVKPKEDATQEPKKDETTSIEDAQEISKIATNYFISQNSNLSFLHFRIHSIIRNTQPDFWIVVCSFDEKFGSKDRIKYELHINKNGTVADLKELT